MPSLICSRRSEASSLERSIQPAQTARHGCRTPAFDLAEDAVAHPQAGCDARAQLHGEDERVAHGAAQVVQHVLSDAELLADLHPRHVEALFEPARGVRVEPARRDRPAVALVSAHLGPGDEFALVEYRHRREHVRRVRGAGERVIEEEDVALVEPNGGVVPVVLEDELGLGVVEQRVEVDAGGRDRQVAAGGEDGSGHVAREDDVGDREVLPDLARLFHDGQHLVVEDLEFDVREEVVSRRLDRARLCGLLHDELRVPARPLAVGVSVVHESLVQLDLVSEGCHVCFSNHPMRCSSNLKLHPRGTAPTESSASISTGPSIAAPGPRSSRR